MSEANHDLILWLGKAAGFWSGSINGRENLKVRMRFFSVSGLNRRMREGALDRKNYLAVRKQLLNDVQDAIILQVTPSVISHSVKLLEHNVLRAMDALHVACALEWKADLFITSDRRQLIAAQNAGLRTEYLGQPFNSADVNGHAAE